MDELAGCLTHNLPPVDELLKFDDFDRLSADQRNAAVDACLSKLYRPERDGYVSPRAVYHLGRLGIGSAVPALVRIMDQPAPFEGDYEAGWALTRIADPICIPKLREVSLREFRAAKFTHPRTSPLVTYGLLASEKAIDDLAEILNTVPPAEAASDENMRLGQGLRTWVGEEESLRGSLPRFASLQTAAAYTLGLIGGPRARNTLLHYLESVGEERKLTSEVARALFRLAPEKLDDWSRKTLESNLPSERYGLREAALAVRFAYFPDTAHDMVRSILTGADGPERMNLVYNVLRYKSYHDEDVTVALIDAFDRLPTLSEPNRRNAFENRLAFIDAIGCQGGKRATAKLLQLAKAAELPAKSS